MALRKLYFLESSDLLQVWEALGEKYDFDPDTVRSEPDLPGAKHYLVFSAEPCKNPGVEAAGKSRAENSLFERIRKFGIRTEFAGDEGRKFRDAFGDILRGERRHGERRVISASRNSPNSSRSPRSEQATTQLKEEKG